ncbi:MAG: hypothetical protein ACREJ5_13765 [Geminicoccaceae bacterium]
MRKLLIGAALGALFAAPAVAGDPTTVTPVNEPLRLSLTQMDGLTAGSCFFSACFAANTTTQVAAAVAIGGPSAFSFGSSNAAANAQNFNFTDQN